MWHTRRAHSRIRRRGAHRAPALPQLRRGSSLVMPAGGHTFCSCRKYAKTRQGRAVRGTAIVFSLFAKLCFGNGILSREDSESLPPPWTCPSFKRVKECAP